MIIIIKILLSAIVVCSIIIIRCAFEDNRKAGSDDDKTSCDVATEKNDYRSHLMNRFTDRK